MEELKEDMEELKERIEKLEQNSNNIFFRLQGQIDEIKDRLREKEAFGKR